MPGSLLLLAVVMFALVGAAGCDLFFDLDTVRLEAGHVDTGHDDTGHTDTGHTDVGDTGPGEPDADTGDTGDADTGDADTGDTAPHDPDIDSGDAGDVDDERDGEGGEACGDATCEPGESCVEGECVRSCEHSNACPQGQLCHDGRCHGGVECFVDGDCPGGHHCSEHTCQFECPVDFGTYDGFCDLVSQTGCDAGRFCSLRVVNATPPPSIVCVQDSEAGARELGERCSNTPEMRCRAGLDCMNWQQPDPRGSVCSQYCSMSTGAGCPVGYYCFRHSAVAVTGDVGLCARRCDPYDPDACPAAQACTADPFTASTCGGEFRCLSNGAPSTPDYMARCTPSALHSAGNGCPDGRTCYNLEAGGFGCVQPCQSDDECRALDEQMTCGPARGPAGLRYCAR